MRNKSIFWILPDFVGKNVKFDPNFHRQWNFWILRNFKCLQLREVQECEIRAEFSSRVHYLDFARFWGQKCEIWAKFSSAVEFLDFAGFQVFTPPGGARIRNSSQIFIASAFFWFCRILGANMWNLRPNFHRHWNFWILPDFKCLHVRKVQECEILAEFSSRVHFLDFAQFWGQKCEIWAKFSSAVEFLDFAGFQELTAPGGARMRNSSRIFIASAFSGFCPILEAIMWNLCQIFIGSGISGFCRISSVLHVRDLQEIRLEFSSREHFLYFARFWGQKCEICAKFLSAVEFLDFAVFQVFTAPGGARMRNSSQIFTASAFSGFCPILVAKMWNLRQIFIGSGISGFCRISSVCRSARCKNVKM